MTVQDDANIALRGVRGLTADLPAFQDATTAEFIAGELAARLRRPKREATITMRADPRRQPGDLVRLQDATGTKVNGIWRVLAVDHSIDGADYTQTLTLIEASLVGAWNQSTWDDGSIWGRDRRQPGQSIGYR